MNEADELRFLRRREEELSLALVRERGENERWAERFGYESSWQERALVLKDALAALLDDTQHVDHVGCTDDRCPVEEARRALAGADWDE